MKEYTLDDLKNGDMELLKKACFLQQPAFLCFGRHFSKLNKLGLIDNEYIPTPYGRSVCKAYLRMMEEK